MPLGEFERKAIRSLLNEANQIRRRAKLKGSILKAGNYKTAPAEPEMLSQIGTIIKRIRGRTNPGGLARLGLNDKTAALTFFSKEADSGQRVTPPRAPLSAQPEKPKARKSARIESIPRVGATGEEARAISKALGNDPDTGWQKLTEAQAMMLLKKAIDPVTHTLLIGVPYGAIAGLLGGVILKERQFSREFSKYLQAERARRMRNMLMAAGAGAGAGAAAMAIAKRDKKK